MDLGVAFTSQIKPHHGVSGKKEQILQSSKQNLIFGKLWLFVGGLIDIGVILLMSLESSMENEKKMEKTKSMMLICAVITGLSQVLCGLPDSQMQWPIKCQFYQATYYQHRCRFASLFDIQW